MEYHCTYLPYQDTHSFSNLVVDYLAEQEALKDFYTFPPDTDGLKNAIEKRKSFPVDRSLLVQVLERQYRDLPVSEPVNRSIQLLNDENTYTVCTAHQPNLLTGYLYFIYKILHAIKLAQELSEKFPENNFVPVYYMGSEDNDLDELGTFRYSGEKYVWDAEGQTGAVGRMSTKSLKKILDNLFKKLGPSNEHTALLKETLTKAYLDHATVGKATQYLVNELFGKYGLIVIDPDDADLKRAFISVMEDDLLQHTAGSIVSKEIERLSEHYKSQAHPRAINLFYLKDQIRERIEKEGDTWKVLNTDIVFDKDTLLQELRDHPERFSPNVVLRGLFQEQILPNIAFIGGGAEVAYWLQLKSTFVHYNIFYPAVLLRQSVLWMDAEYQKRMQELHLTLQELFLPKDELVKTYFLKQFKEALTIDEEANELEVILQKLKIKAEKIDATLAYSTEAVLKKINYQLDILSKKMLRAEKNKNQVVVDRIEKLKSLLFPGNSLQERVENFIEYYPYYGAYFFDILFNAIDPLKNEFLVINAKK